MGEQISTMNTKLDATSQAGQLVSLATCREPKISEAPFSDNLDYLQALEQEGNLILALALLRQRGEDWQSNPDHVRAITTVGLTPKETNPEKLSEQIALVERKNRQKAEVAEQNGVKIFFTKFCREKKIEGFNRTALLLLFLSAVNEKFGALFDLCDFGNAARKGNEIKIGTILNIICHDFREQLASRKYFSLDFPLVQQDILHMESCVDDNLNIFERYVSIQDRYVRYIVGDNNIYESTSNGIQRDTGSIRLDQVIVPEETKKELIARIGNYLAYRDSNESIMLDDFYGYGTALTILFHGPSGTGKTMMAQALATYFNRPLYSLKPGQFKLERATFAGDAIKKLFMEASLNSGIVFFDEADDLFERDTYSSHLLLIEIEKARCVVILSTNKPVNFDPAMDRRLSLKVNFCIPEVELRYKMWKGLMPDFVKLASDIDFNSLAERYQFTGGLIKNSIFMALNSSLMVGNNRNAVVTMKMIEQAAQLQLRQMVDMSDLYQIYTPVCKLSDLQINHEQKKELGNIGKAYQSLHKKNLGLNILITCNDVQTSINAVEALANECNLSVKKFDYLDLYTKTSSDNKILDPITQNKIYPMDYAFAESTGDASLLMFVDYAGFVMWKRDKYKNDYNLRSLHLDMRRHLRVYQGLFCLVTVNPLEGFLPVEFNLHFNMDYPPEETQMQQWEKYMAENKCSDDDLVSLVENNPMHVNEIDFIARQTIIQSTIKGCSGGLTVKDIDNVIARYHPRYSTPLLFGRSK